MLDAPILDRLVRGSGWIPVIAVGLMGIVFMQVSMLKLNSGIGRAVESAATLERQNSELRGEVSALGSNERIEGVARKAGMVVPAAGSFRYVTARPGHTDAREAARGIVPPQPVQPGSKVAEQQPATPAAAAPQTQQPAPAAPQTQQPAAATTPSPVQQQAPVEQQAPVQQAAPAATATETPAG